MWLLLSDCFFSIVKKDCQEDELLVRARRPGDIHKVWPRARVIETNQSDYAYRAVLPHASVAGAIVNELKRITYPNFKNAVRDKRLHSAYLTVWTALADL